MGGRLWVFCLRLWWLGAFAALLLVRLALSVTAGGRGDLPIEISLALGLLAFSMVIAAAVLPSRVRSISRVLGVEAILGWHRWLGLAAILLTLAHVVFVLVHRPADIRLLDLRSDPPRAKAATLATLCLLALYGLMLLRARLRRRYEIFRFLHAVLGIAVLVLAGLHVYWLNHLIRDLAMRICFVSIAVLTLLVLARRWVVSPLLAYRRPFKVVEVRREAPDAVTLALKPVGPHARPFTFRAGQYAWLRLGSPFAVLKERPFSMSSGSHEGDQVEFTVREVGRMTRRLAAVRPGQRVYLDGPHGALTMPRRRSEGVVFVAGGIGITPIMSMLRTLADAGDPRHHRLVVGVRRVEDVLFTEQISDLRARLRMTVVLVLSQPHPQWRGPHGRIDADLLADVLGRRRRDRVDAYVCGPPPMVTSVVAHLVALGVPASRVHSEQFDLG